MHLPTSTLFSSIVPMECVLNNRYRNCFSCWILMSAICYLKIILLLNCAELIFCMQCCYFALELFDLLSTSREIWQRNSHYPIRASNHILREFRRLSLSSLSFYHFCDIWLHSCESMWNGISCISIPGFLFYLGRSLFV